MRQPRYVSNVFECDEYCTQSTPGSLVISWTIYGPSSSLNPKGNNFAKWFCQNALAVKKNCSIVVWIVTWFAAVGTNLSQSSSGSGSRYTLTMFNLHLCLIFRCSIRAIGHAFFTIILSSLFIVVLFLSRDLQIFNTSSKSRLLQNIADALATPHLISSLPLWVTFPPFSRLILGLRPMILHVAWNSCFTNN